MSKYFSEGQKPVVEFDEWVGVLDLATMWFFNEVRSLLLQKFSVLSLKSWPRSEQKQLLNFQALLKRREPWNELVWRGNIEWRSGSGTHTWSLPKSHPWILRSYGPQNHVLTVNLALQIESGKQHPRIGKRLLGFPIFKRR